MSLYYLIVLILLILADVGIVLFSYFRFLRYLVPVKGYTYSISLIVLLFVANVFIVNTHIKPRTSTFSKTTYRKSKPAMASLVANDEVSRAVENANAKKLVTTKAAEVSNIESAEKKKTSGKRKTESNTEKIESVSRMPLKPLLPIMSNADANIPLRPAEANEQTIACDEESVKEHLNAISGNVLTLSEKEERIGGLLKCFSKQNLSILVVEKAIVGSGDSAWEMKGKPMKIPANDYLNMLKSLELGDAIEIDVIKYDKSGKILYIELSEKHKV